MACRVNAPSKRTSAHSTRFAWQVLFLDSFAFVSFHGAGKASANTSTPAVKLRESSSGQRQACELHVQRRSSQSTTSTCCCRSKRQYDLYDCCCRAQSGKPEATSAITPPSRASTTARGFTGSSQQDQCLGRSLCGMSISRT